MTKSGASYREWLEEHLEGAKARYEELSRLDDEAQERDEESPYYEQAHQMFGYIAALEKCLKELDLRSSASGRAK